MAGETNKPTSCFLHVPKSAGTALTLHLQNVLGEANVFHVGDSRYQYDALEVLLRRFRVVTGHFRVAHIPESLYATTFLFTFLREPVDRIVSLYHFLKHGDVDHEGGVVLGAGQDFAGVLAGASDLSRCTMWSNWQTYVFSGAPNAEQPAEELLPAALRNLERFDFVGLYERFAEGVERLGQMRGWPLTTPVPRFKTSRLRPPLEQVEPEVRARIRDLNRCDEQLYARARELWERTKTVPVAVAPLERPPAAQTGPPAAEGLRRRERGTGEVTFSRVEVVDRHTGQDAVIVQGHPLEIRLGLYSQVAADDVEVGILIKDEVGLDVYGTTSRLLGHVLPLAAGTGVELRFAFDLHLAPGGYRLTVAVEEAGAPPRKTFHWIDDVTIFWCVRDEPLAFVGLVDMRAALTVGEIQDGSTTGS